MQARRKKAAVLDREVFAALDVGTHKICCLVAAAQARPSSTGESRRQLQLLGFGLQRSAGIAGGAVVDFQAARSAVAAAVSQAEQSAGIRIDRVTLGLSAGTPRSRTFSGHVDLPSGVVEAGDIARLGAGALAYAAGGHDALVTLNRMAFVLDGTGDIQRPEGLAGRRLQASHHAVTATPGPLANLRRLVESCQLEVDEIAPAAFASGLAATTQDERRAGVVVVDIGAAVTALAAFTNGQFAYTSTLPVGGQHITSDMAQALRLPLAEAERIKTLYGSVAVSASDEHEMIALARHGALDMTADAASTLVTRGDLCRIVERRMAWVLTGVRASIDGIRLDGSWRGADTPIVLTGGGAELMGLEQLAVSVFERSVRIATLPGIPGASGRIPGSVPNPAFACVIGLALLASGPSPWLSTDLERAATRSGYLGRVEQWLRESF